MILKSGNTAYTDNNLNITGGVVDVSTGTLASGNDITLSTSNLNADGAKIIRGRHADGSNASTGDLSISASGNISFEGGT